MFTRRVVATLPTGALVAAGLLAALAGVVHGQVPAKPSAAVPVGSTLPVAQPTANAPGSAAPDTPRQAEATVRVEWAGGKLDVDATNASLNQILREVSEKAGVKITGGVTDERVFGHYGPSSMATVLATLLDGTGSNMLLVDDSHGKSELILTPRRGGASPPNPNAATQSRDPEDQVNQRYVPPVRPFQAPTNVGRPGRPTPDGSPANGAFQPPDPNQQGDGSQPPQPPQ